MRIGTFSEYKGVIGTIEYSAEDRIYHGSIENIRDYVNYEANNIEELFEEFHKAVDDYLDFCKEIGKLIQEVVDLEIENETGIIRRIDDLGRIVIPKEIRRHLRIKEGDAFEEKVIRRSK